MSEFAKITPRAPETFTVTGGAQTLLSDRPTSIPYTVLYITNNSEDTPIFLGFSRPGSEVGNAAVNAGITVFPRSTVVFDDVIPTGCSVWATCETGSAVVGVQQ